MKKRMFALVIIIFILSAGWVFSHEEEQNYTLDNNDFYPLSQKEAVGYGSLVFGIILALMLLFNRYLNENMKKLIYSLIVIVIVSVTLYLVIVTLHLNITSVSKGPVHWHADYEMWVCGNELNLAKPHSMLSNKQGADLMHSHVDNRIHVEGVMTDFRQASIGAFFKAVGGSITDDSLKVPTDNGLVSVHNGDICNGQPAKLYVFVNGMLNGDPAKYVISPFDDVPPGDTIKIVFTEKQIGEINPIIGKNGS
jgi:hypothetical protein